jgi:beta-lactamase superfamily II metal-dependent hydrolase
MAISTTQPRSDQAEISLFGPGIGECVVIHTGGGRWFIVDSCLDPLTRKPIALDYLTYLGVDPDYDVEGILITHWHQDHIDGACDLIKACKCAKLYISAALLENEACHLASLFHHDDFSSYDKDIREFSAIVDFLVESNQRERIDTVSERHVFFDRRSGPHARLVAMSPSSSAKLQAMANMKARTPTPGEKRTRNIVRQSPNHNAVALHFSFGKFSAILGADLEETGNAATGWSAILRSGLHQSLSLSSAAVFKVPHHGSETGHHDQVWSELLAPKPVSITTPYASSNLPKASDISRISKRSDVFWVTRDPQSKKKIKRERMVEREMKSVVIERKAVNESMGHLQLRIEPTGRIDISDNGVPVSHSC